MQRPQLSRVQSHRRMNRRNNLGMNPLTIALSVGLVLVLLAITFVADWLHVPDLTVTSATQLISPNGDQSNDTATVVYSLSEEAEVAIQVLGEGGGLVRTLGNNQLQPAGQYFVTWDGLDNLNRVVEDGHYRLQVSAKGTVRSTLQGVSLQVDTHPPSLQIANVPDGLRVGEKSLTVEGITEPDATLWLSGTHQPVTVDSQGRFVLQLTLAEGENQFEVSAVDPAGNQTQLTRSVALVTTPPELTINDPFDGAWVNNALVTLSGHASPFSLLTINGQTVSVDDEGVFQHQLVLNEGSNVIRLQATDDVGNINTLEHTVWLKTLPPQVELGIANGSIVGASVLELTGHTDPGATILVNGQVVPVSTLGDFQTSVSLFQGENDVIVEARDQVGNVTTLSRRVIFEVQPSSSGMERLLRGLTDLPPLTLPIVGGISLFIAWIVFRQQQVSLALSVDQQTFTPGLPGDDDTLELTLDLDKTARVTVQVLDQQRNLLTSILNDRWRGARRHLLYWDGHDDFGRALPPGEYIIQALADTSSARATSAVQVSIQEDYLGYQPAEQRRISTRRHE